MHKIILFTRYNFLKWNVIILHIIFAPTVLRRNLHKKVKKNTGRHLNHRNSYVQKIWGESFSFSFSLELKHLKWLNSPQRIFQIEYPVFSLLMLLMHLLTVALSGLRQSHLQNIGIGWISQTELTGECNKGSSLNPYPSHTVQCSLNLFKL